MLEKLFEIVPGAATSVAVLAVTIDEPDDAVTFTVPVAVVFLIVVYAPFKVGVDKVKVNVTPAPVLQITNTLFGDVDVAVVVAAAIVCIE